MGWFASAGSFARIVLPVTSGYLEQWADGSSFNLVLLLLAGSYLAVLVIRPRLVRMTNTAMVAAAPQFQEDDQQAMLDSLLTMRKALRM